MYHFLILLSILIIVKIFIWRICPFVYQYFIISENRIIDLYPFGESDSKRIDPFGESDSKGIDPFGESDSKRIDPFGESDSKRIGNSQKVQRPWVLITGASGGMGKRFSIEFYERGFNLFLIGSKRINNISEKFDKNRVILLEKDFSKSFEENFFNDIDSIIDKLGLDFTVLINNVGYRTGWTVYEDMPLEEIKKD